MKGFAPCLLKGFVQGWWIYEVCCLSHINQYHAEKKQLQAAHSLGQLRALPSHFHAINTT